MKKLAAILPLLWLVSGLTHGQPAGYEYSRTITIQASQVSGDLTDFPVVISFFNDNSLKNVLHPGGKIHSFNGYDIVFTDFDCSTILDHQVEEYDQTNGSYVAWVRLPFLSASENTVIRVYYSNSSISDDDEDNPSTFSTWDSDYVAIYHLHDDYLDATNNSNNASNFNSVDAPGKVGDCQSFNGTSNFIGTPTDDLKTENNFTVSAWFKANSTQLGHILWQGDTNNGTNGWGNSAAVHQEMNLSTGYCCPESGPASPDYLSFFLGETEEEVDSDVLSVYTSFTNITDWQYVVAIVSNLDTSPTTELFLNGVSIGTNTGVANDAVSRVNWQTALKIGGHGGRFFDGFIDEVRVSKIVRSSDWILTEYRNQNDPSSFYNVSAEVPVSSCALPIELSLFDAIPSGGKVKLVWTTHAEYNNDFFTIERSKDALQWEEVNQIRGAGNSRDRIHYTEWDHHPYSGVSYYRLMQTDFDGTFTYSWTRRVDLEPFFNFQVYPNPAKEEFTIVLESYDQVTVKMFNNLGQPVTMHPVMTNNGMVVNATGFHKGVYYLQIDNGQQVRRKMIIVE